MIIDKQKDTVWAIRNEGGCSSIIALELWTRYSIEAGNTGDLEALRRDVMVGASHGGFYWGNTPQGGGAFWSSMLDGRSHPLLTGIIDEVMDYIDFQHFN